MSQIYKCSSFFLANVLTLTDLKRLLTEVLIYLQQTISKKFMHLEYTRET